MPITGLTSASEPKHTQEGKRGARVSIKGLTSASKSNTHKECGDTKVKKKRKGARRDQLNLLPTYLIWYEDQGDVVPLWRNIGLA